MKSKWFVAALSSMALACPALAQSVVGNSIVNGREVQLLSDGTWKYSKPAPAGCQTVQDNVAFCGQSTGWTRSSDTGGNPDVAALYELDDRSGGLFVVEKLGSEDGVSLQFLRSNVLDHAANANGLTAKDVITLGAVPDQVDGLPGDTLIYSLKVNGLPVVYMNTMVITQHQTVQLITYSVGPAMTDGMKSVHKRFLDATRLK